MLVNPRPWMYWYGFGAMIFGLWLAHNDYPIHYYIVGFYLYLFIFAAKWTDTLSKALKFYAGYKWDVPTHERMVKGDTIVTDAQPIPAVVNLNGKPMAYEQVVVAVKFDKERQFAKTLLAMRELAPQDKAVDLREDRWGEHFGSKDRYRYVRDYRWFRLLAKQYPRNNSPYRVTDWTGVELVARGNKDLLQAPSPTN